MAATNHERVGKALDLLKAGLGPFVDREVQSAVKVQRVNAATLRSFVDDPRIGDRPVTEWDVAALLKLMWETWNDVFRSILGPAERGFVGELRGHRNRWAHQEPFSSDDAYRALDTANRLLTAVSAGQAGDVEKLKMELLRVRFDEQARGERRKQASLAIGGAAAALKPWREVVTPHQDVASGRYQQAEFAADLWQAHLGEGTDEYRDPVEFFRRTYLTESLKGMLAGAAQRLTGSGGDPVVQLQTNFGGGKTHSMLALYHLCSGIAPTELAGGDALLRDAGVAKLPQVNRVVLVGNRISPGNPTTKDDGTVVRTLWGELAWQLGGKDAYASLAADDEHATSPGDTLRQLLVDHGPCLILIDEWVAYARQLHDQSDLPAGSFETQFTFAQALTESAKLAGNCLLVVSLPRVGRQRLPALPGGRHRSRWPAWAQRAGPAAQRHRAHRVVVPAGERRGRVRDRPAATVPAVHGTGAVQGPGRRGPGVRGPLPRPTPPGIPNRVPRCRLREAPRGCVPDPPGDLRPPVLGLVDAGDFPADPRRAAAHGGGHSQPLGEGRPQPAHPPSQRVDRRRAGAIRATAVPQTFK